MIAKRNDDQITLPKAVVNRFAGVELFEVSTDGDSIVLRPAVEDEADAVQRRLEKMGITEQDIADAVAWARSQP